jgi:hypothetical protein
MFSGISQSSLNVVALSIVGVFILGAVIFLFWKYIAVGALALFAVVVLANQSYDKLEPKVAENKVVPQVIEQFIIEPSKPPPVATPKNEFITEDSEEKPLFMEDCLRLTDYTEEKCAKIWNKNQNADIKLLDVENVEYKKRRSEALKKPGAIVAQFTLQDRK